MLPCGKRRERPTGNAHGVRRSTSDCVVALHCCCCSGGYLLLMHAAFRSHICCALYEHFVLRTKYDTSYISGTQKRKFNTRRLLLLLLQTSATYDRMKNPTPWDARGTLGTPELLYTLGQTDVRQTHTTILVHSTATAAAVVQVIPARCHTLHIIIHAAFYVDKKKKDDWGGARTDATDSGPSFFSALPCLFCCCTLCLSHVSDQILYTHTPTFSKRSK